MRLHRGRVLGRVAEACPDEPDMDCAMVDATIVKVHRRGQGAKDGTQSQAVGQSRGGPTAKILALTDALGNLVRFRLMPGHRHDSVGVPPLIDGVEFGSLNADKAFNNNAPVAGLNERGAKVAICQHPGRASKLAIDASLYAWRHLIETFSCKLKPFKRTAMRACKIDQSFAAMIHLAAIINSR